MSDRQKAEAFILSHHWVVVAESCGVPEIVGTPMRVQRISGTSPAMPYCLCITPLKLSEQDQRFHGLFKRVKPIIKKLEGTTLSCTPGIILEPINETHQQHPSFRTGPDGQDNLSEGDHGVWKPSSSLPSAHDNPKPSGDLS